MNLKVRDLMNQFQDFQILAGAGGLDKNVTNVIVMDAPDIYDWLKGGEFIITTGYILEDNSNELKNLIVKLNEQGTSAFGIKLGEFIHTLPSEIIELGNTLNFTIIHIPKWYALTDIINPVLSTLVNKQAEKIILSEKIHKSFTQIVVEGKDSIEIMKTLYKILGKEVAYINIAFNQNYFSSNSSRFKIDIENLRIEKILNKYCNFPLEINNSIYGYLVVNLPFKECLEDIDQITIDHASTVLKLNIQKDISNRHIEQKYRNEFIQDLIINNVKTIDEANARAALYGWEIKKGLLCLIVDIDGLKEKFISLKDAQDLIKESQIIFQIVINQLKKYFKQIFYTNYSDYIVFLVEPDTQKNEKFLTKLKDVSEIIRSEVRDKCNFSVTVAIGDYRADITDIYLSFLEAQKALEIGKIIYGKDKTHIYSELGVYKILYKIALEKESINFCNEYLRALIDYDTKKNTELMLTLKTIIKNDWNLKQSSEELFIHYNTIKNRFNKISKILCLDFKKREDKFTMELCIKLTLINI